MAWIYKNHYGRTIICELGSDNNHVYENGKYREKTEIEKQMELDEIYEKTKIEIEKKKKIKETKEIIKTKEKIGAIKKIQNWWRNILYNPNDGIFYLQSKINFDNLTKN